VLRLDIALTYANRLIVLRDDSRLFVRLLRPDSHRMVFVTPKLEILESALLGLMSTNRGEIPLGPISLTVDEKYLSVNQRNIHMSVKHDVWKPMVSNWLEIYRPMP